MDGSVGISVVVPVFNEAENLRPLVCAVVQELARIGLSYEIILVDDGSRDQSLDILRKLADENRHVKVVSLSRNFGHQAAITAGLERSEGRAVIVMDGDLQHPPELIPQMIAAWREGAQVVYTIRQDTHEIGWFERWTSGAFYRCINLISDTPIIPGASDFRLMDRIAVEAILVMPERSRFLRGMISWLGFRQVGLSYQVQTRLNGRSKYSFRRMASLALQGITSFSTLPLRISAVLGLIAAGVESALRSLGNLREVLYRCDGARMDFPCGGGPFPGRCAVDVDWRFGRVYRTNLHRSEGTPKLSG